MPNRDTVSRMSDDATDADGLRDRLAKQSEDAIGRIAQELLENPLVTGAIAQALGARERAAQAQEVAMGALNIPSAADVERLTRRVRSVSQRLEGIEDGVDRLDGRFVKMANEDDPTDSRLKSMEEQLSVLTRELTALREALPGAAAPVPSSQERLEVSE
jgi:hypothetical protein